MLLTVLASFVAGLLTVLAPCVLPFLPVVVGGSLQGPTDRRRPFVVAASLVTSLCVFTLLLKASTLLVDVDPRVWTIGSGVLVMALGLAMLFPGAWAAIAGRTGLDSSSHRLLDGATHRRGGTAQAIAIGAALGPVFSSCSPTYAWVIASVLPAHRGRALAYLAAYCIGVAAMLLAVSLVGRRLVDRLGWAANPRGAFQRTIAVLMVVVGLCVATGTDKRLQAWGADHVPAVTSSLERSVLARDAGGKGTGTGRQAPELVGITGWINSQPLTLQQLRGKVVLVDFWTYSCVNCVRTQPYLNAWYQRYHRDGLEIIGVHAPEFAFERQPDNVRRAVKAAGIAYPVALDDDFRTWGAWDNRYWPSKYLVDRDGNVVAHHEGEGGYEETEDRIRELLGATGPRAATPGQPSDDVTSTTPETYLGSARAERFAGGEALADGLHDFGSGTTPRLDEWTLSGRWRVAQQESRAVGTGAGLDLDFQGTDVFLVLEGPSGARVHARLDGTSGWGRDVDASGTLRVDAARMYHLVHAGAPASGARLHLDVPEGVAVHAFTFG